ncbi:MAG TPA: type II toxin-antitoxin system RelE/ParE family toxin, partial [Gammaproteobacteria bacterium]|nr:type II toxin-antitoxin system RelE/ParE family toxin [Gammaproteobacteria bacterium]
EDIDDYISKHDSPQSADTVLGKIEETMLDLAKLPNRDTFPRELSSLGIREYREIFFKPYRIIYRVIDTHVYIYVITDGRRDMQTLLGRRMLGT